MQTERSRSGKSGRLCENKDVFLAVVAIVTKAQIHRIKGLLHLLFEEVKWLLCTLFFLFFYDEKCYSINEEKSLKD